MTVSAPSTRSWRTLVLLPLIIYSIAVMLITWPLAAQLTTHLAGAEYADSMEYARLGWWARTALLHGENPLYQGRLAYPNGYFDAIQWAQPLIYWPIALLGGVFGDIAGYNIWLLSIIIANGLTTYWLCRVLLCELQPAHDPTWPSLWGGLVYVMLPVQQGHLVAGHINPVFNIAVPIFILCLHRVAEQRGTQRTIIIGAVALWITMLGNYTAPVFVFLPLLLFGGLYYLIFRRQQITRRALSHLSAMLALGTLLCVPFYLPLIQQLVQPASSLVFQEGGSVKFSTDPLAFISLSPFTPWGASLAPAFSRAAIGTNTNEGTAYLGLVSLILALTALWRWPVMRQWGVILLSCMLFSLGPLLKWQDQPVRIQLNRTDQTDTYNQSYIVMPWALFQALPVFGVSRTPGRFNLTGGFMLAILAAVGMAYWWPRWGKSARWFVLLGLASLMFFEYQVFFPYPVTPAVLAPVFADQTVWSSARAVLDVPWDDPLAQKAALWQQTQHDRPLLAGYVARRTAVDPAMLHTLSDLVLKRYADPAISPLEIQAWLRQFGVDVVVYHWQLVDRAVVSQWAEQVFGAPAYVDEKLSVYRVPDPAKPPTTPLMVWANSGWQTDSMGSHWLGHTANMYYCLATEGDFTADVQLQTAQGSQPLQLLVDGKLTSVWHVIGARRVPVYLHLAAGCHTLRWSAPNGCQFSAVAPQCLLNGQPYQAEQCGLTQPQCLSLGLIKVAPLAQPLRYQPNVVRLGDGLQLLGQYLPSKVKAGESITVGLFWQTSNRPSADYHLFIHVLDAQGQPIAQFDGIPGDNTYSTQRWEAEQRWVETIQFTLPKDLPTGDYPMFTGWYTLPDGLRLPVSGMQQGAADGLVYLGTLHIE